MEPYTTSELLEFIEMQASQVSSQLNLYKKGLIGISRLLMSIGRSEKSLREEFTSTEINSFSTFYLDTCFTRIGKRGMVFIAYRKEDVDICKLIESYNKEYDELVSPTLESMYPLYFAKCQSRHEKTMTDKRIRFRQFAKWLEIEDLIGLNKIEPDQISAIMEERCREVLPKTVGKDVGSFLDFVRFCMDTGKIDKKSWAYEFNINKLVTELENLKKKS